MRFKHSWQQRKKWRDAKRASRTRTKIRMLKVVLDGKDISDMVLRLSVEQHRDTYNYSYLIPSIKPGPSAIHMEMLGNSSDLKDVLDFLHVTKSGRLVVSFGDKEAFSAQVTITNCVKSRRFSLISIKCELITTGVIKTKCKSRKL
jgi:hypothetical protein